MAKLQKFITTPEEVEAFIDKAKSIVISTNFQSKPRDSRYAEIICNILDEDRITIPEWTFIIRVKTGSKRCQDSYYFTKRQGSKNESVLRLDVVPKGMIGHRQQGQEFSSHIHILNQVEPVDDKYNFDCEDCHKRKEWLKLMSIRFNFSIIEAQDETDLFGGWECSA